MNYSRLEELFANGKHEFVLTELKKQKCNKELRNKILNLSNQYESAKKESNLGLSDVRENERNLNRIKNAILEVMCEIEELVLHPEFIETQNYNNIAADIKKNKGKKPNNPKPLKEPRPRAHKFTCLILDFSHLYFLTLAVKNVSITSESSL